MATYVEGVSNVLPQIQPFQPDLNFYANALGTKQNQYDTNWKALNNMYGKFYYADLTRDSSIEKKENLIKDIDFNMKRVAGLDLSLQQNVTAAAQVFKPYYEDKALMKDMAWTQNYMNSRGRATGLKNADDEKMRTQYWDAGVRELDYKREEFKETTDSESLGFGNIEYTPYLNVSKEAGKIAKEAGLSVESVEFSPDGRWLIKKKNGEKLMAPLQHLFESTLGKDPRIMDVYKTQAYVNRKDYSYTNAAQFGDDKNAAEMDYLEKNFTMLKQMNENRTKELVNTSKVTSNKIASVEKNIKESNVLPGVKGYLESLQEAQAINDEVLNQAETLNETLAGGSSTASTSSGFQNPYGDIKSLRQKVDAGMASSLMQKDLGEAAYIYAHKDMKMDIEANPYKVLEIQQANRMKAISASKAADMKNAVNLRGLKNNTKIELPNGEIIDNPAYAEITSEASDDSTIPEINLADYEKQIMGEQYNKSPAVFMGTLLQMIETDSKSKNPEIGEDDLKSIFGYKVDINQLRKGYKEGGVEYLETLTRKYSKNDKDGDSYLSRIATRTKEWLKANQGTDVVNDNMPALSGTIDATERYGILMNEYIGWKADVKKSILDKMGETNDALANAMWDENNNLLDKEVVMESLDVRAKYEGANLVEAAWSSLGNKLKTYKVWDKEAMREGAVSQFHNKKLEEYKSAWDTKKYQPEGLRWLLGTKMGSIRTDKSTQYWVDVAHEAMEDRFDTLYDKVSTAYGKSSTYKTTGKAPYIPSLTAGSGLSSERGVIQVNPKAWGTLSHNVWRELESNLGPTDINGSTVVITAEGRSKLAFDNAVEASEDDPQTAAALMGVIDALKAETSNQNSKLGTFTVKAQKFAAGDQDKAAITIMPTRDYLEDHIKTGDKDKDIELVNNIVKNGGITIMGDYKAPVFQTTLLNSTVTDDITAIVQSKRGKYKYEHPSGTGNIIYTQNEYNSSGIQAEFNYIDHYNANNEGVWRQSTTNTGPGEDLVQKNAEFIAIILNQQEKNLKKLYNGGR